MQSVHVPFLDLKQQYRNMQDEIDAAIRPLLVNASYIEGAPVTELETKFAEFCGVREAVAVDSGTAALHLALVALDIGPGDEVVCPTSTFIATAAAIAVTGAKPVFVDADPNHWQMDVTKLEAAIGLKCKAVMPVHLYGQPVQIREVQEICAGKNIVMIEDSAQAHGARYMGQRTGSFGVAAGFSFYPGKNLGAYGDGGIITTNDAALAERMRRLRNHGRLTKYEHAEIGFNFRMDSIQGAVLNVKLKYLDQWNERRRHWAAKYREKLASLPVRLPALIPGTEPVHHLFPVLTPQRDRLGEFLKTKGIESGLHYPLPLHMQPAFRHLGYKKGDFPVAEEIAIQELSLPIFPEMTDTQHEAVCNAVGEFFKVCAAHA
jgi:dTDP-4-amino-4,6-dideoxygalactose transaminase